MNKEIIKKYKNEFDHWLNGGTLLCTDGCKKWSYAEHPTFKYDNLTYIINDEYVEFRKAVAEGETIQRRVSYGEDWVDSNLTDMLNYPIHNIRIKSEEHKFRVGDWVILDFVTLDKDDKHRKCKVQIKGIKDNNYYYDKECTSLISELPNNLGDWIITELWEPKPGEWCWFWNEGMDCGFLAQLDSFDLAFDKPYFIQQYFGKGDEAIDEFKYCEPFIGEFPSHLKNKIIK